MNKMIIFDLDGTLFDSNKQISEQTLHKILSLQQKGAVAGIATGRFYNELDPYINMLKLKEYKGFTLSSNGLEIHDFSDNEAKSFLRISKDKAEDIIRLSSCFHLIPYVYEDDTYHMFHMYMLKNPKKIFDHISFKSHYIESIKNIILEKDVVLHENLYDKICFAGMPIHIKKFQKFVLKHYPGFTFYPVNSYCTELCTSEVGKLQATQYLCNKKNIPLSSVMFFGDSGNDVDLLRECGCGIAMKNGMKDTKKVAKYISNFTNRHEGVLDMLNQFYPTDIDKSES